MPLASARDPWLAACIKRWGGTPLVRFISYQAWLIMDFFIVIGGLFCVLAIIGFFVSGKPYAFAGHSMVVLAGLAFAALIGATVYSLEDCRP